MCYEGCFYENYYGECTKSTCLADTEQENLEADAEFWQELKLDEQKISAIVAETQATNLTE